ncbi:hypothetical protein [Rhodococcus sp. IEGM 1379]|uniref:hypothetical protein n=1 Tax=Rhodococcus sp. IEGM 1379 TaxID=3047086 RepID=UPI0024B6EEE0|nr:hypothetical protein [Rhodococcus sp. IEGM 1379]MDI9917862.1 hypothetical protein [Rhodococcus sp. IEGM 1379]
MTAPINPTTPEAEPTPVTPEPLRDPATPEVPETPEAEAKPDNEAAKYRRRLRDTETERDTFANRLDSLQRQVISSACDAAGFKAAGFWASGVEMKDLLTEDGEIDPDKVSTAITTAVSTLGLALTPRTPKPNRQQGVASARVDSETSWSKALGGK